MTTVYFSNKCSHSQHTDQQNDSDLIVLYFFGMTLALQSVSPDEYTCMYELSKSQS